MVRKSCIPPLAVPPVWSYLWPDDYLTVAYLRQIITVLEVRPFCFRVAMSKSYLAVVWYDHLVKVYKQCHNSVLISILFIQLQ